MLIMNCSECGGIVAVDQMLCKDCGHDMLAEDIASRPVDGAPAWSLMNSLVTSLFEARARLQPVSHFPWSPHGTEWSVRPPVDRRG